MKRALWISYSLLLLIASAVVSAAAIPIGGSFCTAQNSAGEDFAASFFMFTVAAATLTIGGVGTALLLLRAWRKSQTTLQVLSNVSAGAIAIPLFWLCVSVAYNYQTCPGFGRTLTPEQQENLRHG